MKLHELKPNKGARRPTKRLGRGPGTGQGKTAGKGHKGQNARAGGGVRRGFEGGQMPLQRRLPKRGFYSNYNEDKEATAIINVGALERFGAGAVVDLAFLTERRIVPLKTSKILRVLGNGTLNVSLTVRAHYFTPQARAKIEAAGGQAEVI